MKTLLLWLAAAAVPAFAGSVTQIDISWNVTKKATNQTICAGRLNEAFSGTVCGGLIPGFSGIEFTVSGASSSGAMGASADVFADAAVFANFQFNPLEDENIYSVDAMASVVSEALLNVKIIGGSGVGLVQSTGSAGGGTSNGTLAGFSAGAGIDKVDCFHVFGLCNGFLPFTFGQPFVMNAFASVNLNGIPHGLGVGASALGVARIDGIFDLNHNPIDNAQIVLVPEPGSWFMLIGGMLATFGAKKSGLPSLPAA